MPLLRRDDPARRLGSVSIPTAGDDRRPVLDRLTEPRQGLPARRPYTYRGSGEDVLTAGMDGDPATCVAPMRALSRAALLDVCEAIDGPNWLDWLEWRDEEHGA